MLSLGKLAAGPDAGRYYEEAVARGREDYYAGEGEAPGQWVGAGATTLGLQGSVDDGQVGHLLAGEDPATGALLGRKITEGRVAGFDLTFKAPKSVAILFCIGEPQVAGVLRECHERQSSTRSVISSARPARPVAAKTVWRRFRARASSSRRSDTGPRVPAIRCCTRMSSSPTASRGPTAAGRLSTRARSSARERPPG